MLSPHTPPGTRVVRVEPVPHWTEQVTSDWYDFVRDRLAEGMLWADDPEGIQVVDATEAHAPSSTGFLVRFVNIDGAFCTLCYRRVDLPSVLTDLLVGTHQPQGENA